MKLQRKHLVVVVAAIVVLTLVGWRMSSRKASASQGDQAPVRIAAVALVERKPIINSLTLSGEFKPYQEVDVHAKVAGYIKRIYVDVGDKVRSGQVLATLEVPELNAQVTGAEAAQQRNREAIRRAQGDVERTESLHVASHASYSRLEQASKARPGLIAQQELDDALAKDKEGEAQVSSARAALAEANSELSVAEAERNRLGALQAYARITAPFAGVVTHRYADVGSLIQAGTASNTQTMPVVQLAEWVRLRLVVPVPESAVPQLHLGSAVDVRVPTLNRTFHGVVARYADSLGEETRTMHTEIDVNNADGTLVGGMYAETTVVLHEKDDALSVPIQAIERNGASSSVMFVDGQNRVREQVVKLGQENSDRVEILSGLNENDRVIVGSRSDFHAGDVVKPKVIEEPAAGTGGGL